MHTHLVNILTTNMSRTTQHISKYKMYDVTRVKSYDIWPSGGVVLVTAVGQKLLSAV